MNKYRVHYRDNPKTEHEAIRIEVGIHGTLVMWGGTPTNPRIALAWAPGAWVHVELLK
ncbi:hypothetical protein LCGC14_2086920 [marine sediment metagenome]|uniref:Uncharacterized protein n=1 Tax=marine sediment metagenome TaxID=412755 RepID=A0A0F9EE39_9ZZZZ